jgi:hypothetical protein
MKRSMVKSAATLVMGLAFVFACSIATPGCCGFKRCCSRTSQQTCCGKHCSKKCPASECPKKCAASKCPKKQAAVKCPKAEEAQPAEEKQE